MSERKCLRSNEKNTTNNILASAKLHVPKISYVCLANRSACFLKLGHPEKALDDAESCVKLDPSYIKGVFRQGMALHALERFEEAIPVLAKSLEMEPKNKQVKQVRVWEGGGVGGWGVVKRVRSDLTLTLFLASFYFILLGAGFAILRD